MTVNKKTIVYVLLAALIAIPLSGCFGGAPANSSPTCDFSYSPSTPTTDDYVQFTDQSTDADGTVVGRAWDFGDGGTSTTQNPSHTFDDAGAFTVTLTAEDDDGATSTCTTTVTVVETTPPEVAPPIEIELDDALEILMGEVLKPAASGDRVSAFILSQPLQAGDVVTSQSGQTGWVEDATWFAFIDDDPAAAFAHATRYVTIDADDGECEVINDIWPPEINGVSMWDTTSLNRGDLIDIYPVLDSAVPIAGTRSDAPTADYGDAPDGQDAYYGVLGRFPTLYNTSNSLFSRPGGHTLNIGEETIGFNVSPEVDANDLNDPDLVPNLVDADSDERFYVLASGGNARLAVTVSVSAGAPDITRYINVLIDLDQSGNWSDSIYAKEWVAINLPVDVDPGTSRTIITPEFPWGIQSVPPPPVWMRVALTREQVDETLFANAGGWDGSGQFEYGEIEDYFAFLMDNPPLPEWVPVWPPVWPPDGPGNGGAPPPGPAKGPCGFEPKYYSIIVNGGDHPKHINQGTPYMGTSADRMADVAKDQGYTSAANLGPGNNSSTDLANAIKNLAKDLRCGDYLLIYICGHGSPAGGIAMKNASGSTKDMLTPKELKDILDTIESCDEECCETKGKCCHVSVVIESCFAGNFKNIAGEGRAVMGASDTTESWLNYPSGGYYTRGFDEDLRKTSSDKSTPPDGVDPAEAQASAEATVAKHNESASKDQVPWHDNQWCECDCCCKPGIIVEKWIWDEITGEWVDELEVPLDQWIEFLISIESSGTCRDIVDIVLIDYLPYCLSYGGEAMLYYNDEAYPREPCTITEGEYGLELTWNLGEDIAQLPPGDIVEIGYGVWPVYPGENINEIYGEAHCVVDYSVEVSDEASATVWATEEPD